MLLDLDRFKEINDALGHGVGDELLRAVAHRLEIPLRPPATLARLGGDEFAVLLPATTPDRAWDVARSLVDALKQPFALESLSVKVDTSVGITLSPDHGDDAQTLVQRADVAMYVAKESRRGIVLYGPEQDRHYLRRLTIKEELRRAIDGGALRLAFQPKVHHATERIVGAEALLRWEHPQRGFIPPDELVAVAEHSGLIRPLTEWVLETALSQAALWREAGTPLGLAVNLSARNLTEEDLPERLEAMLARRALAPRHLTLEITEGVIMADLDTALTNMRRLRDLGVGLAVDDFGTGYSSLAYLARLPLSELKIDKSFVFELDRDVGNATIVRSTIELAHKLGMQVVAEGVETAAVWERLKRLGCDLGQGYYFGRPAPAEELSARLAEAYAPSSNRAMRSQCLAASSRPTSSSRSM
jgi:diguanylate cyclase (GGDEF)-like protein